MVACSWEYLRQRRRCSLSTMVSLFRLGVQFECSDCVVRNLNRPFRCILGCVLRTTRFLRIPEWIPPAWIPAWLPVLQAKFRSSEYSGKRSEFVRNREITNSSFVAQFVIRLATPILPLCATSGSHPQRPRFGANLLRTKSGPPALTNDAVRQSVRQTSGHVCYAGHLPLP